MEVIMDQITKLSNTLYRVRMLLSMNFHPNTRLDRDEDFYNLEIPTVPNDRKNLKRDIKAIGRDMKKALNKKKSEFIDQ